MIKSGLKPIVLLFSGQGSHYRGMGRELFEQHPKFRSSLESMDKVVRKQLNSSLIEELYTKKEEPFEELLITHPAIVAVEIALYEVITDMGIKPDFVSGNSLGEFAAGVANGIWDATAAIEAAIEQAKSICRSDIDGGMLAVLTEEEKLKDLYLEHQLFLASNNFSGHFTLSGRMQDLKLFEQELSRLEINFFRLPVTSPFHSPLLQPASVSFSQYTASVAVLGNPKPGFVSGFTGKEMEVLTEDYFWQVVSQYTNFSETVSFFENVGPCLYIDMGPSGTSAAFVKYNLQSDTESEIFQIMSPYKGEMKQLKKLQAIIG